MQEEARFKFGLFALLWVMQCCNANLYYLEVYRPLHQQYPISIRYPYGFSYTPYSYSYAPVYFNAIAYPAPPVVQQETPEPAEHLTPEVKTEETQNSVNKIEPASEKELIKEVHIEASKDSAPMRDKSLLANIFDPLLGNRKAVNILANFPNFKLTRTSGSKTISIQGISVG